MTQQSHESQFTFALVKKGETENTLNNPLSSSSSYSSQQHASTNLSSTSSAIQTNTTTATQNIQSNTGTSSTPSSAASSPLNSHFLPLDEEEPLPTLSSTTSNMNGSKGVEREPHASDEIPARSLTNVIMEGWLKKLTTKKEWKKRYFMLSNNHLYYYKSPQDRKLTNVINMANYAAKPTNLQAKEAKYWAFELYLPNTPAKAAKSPRKDKGNGLILRCENEQEMHSWLAAIRGDNTPKPAPQPVPDRRSRAKSGYPHAVFGVELAKSVPVGAEIPNIVDQAIKYIDAKALDLVGIYRLSGSAPTIANWKRLFDKGDRVDLNQEPDPHAVAGLLKLFLRELPEPILTFDKYDDFIDAVSHTTKWSKVKAIKDVCATLVGVNRTILLTLVQHLRRVNEKCEINKMHLANLATVFGPTLLRKPASNPGADSTGFDATVYSMVVDTPAINELCMFMIEDYDYIFGNKVIPHSATFARALYAYNGEDQNTELSFEAGSIIRVTQMGQKDAWWMGQILLSPNSELIGKSGCFPGSYVEPVPGTSADWISLSALYTLTENVEANRGQIVNCQNKLDSLEKAKAQEIINKEAAASKGEKKQQAIAEAVGVNPQLDRLWEHMDELVILISLHSKSAQNADVDNVRQSFVADVEQLNNAKFKNKSDKEAFALKLDTLRASLETEKQARNKLSITTNIVLKDIEFLKNMLR